jgi:hypothetical protein
MTFGLIPIQNFNRLWSESMNKDLMLAVLAMDAYKSTGQIGQIGSAIPLNIVLPEGYGK